MREKPRLVVISPNALLLVSVFAPPNFGVLVRFRISNRTSPLCDPANENPFVKTASVFWRNW